MTRRSRIFAGSAALLACGAAVVHAQDLAPAAVAAAPEGIDFEMMINLGVKSVYVVLGVLSFVTLALILYFSVSLRKGMLLPQNFRTELLEKIEAGWLDEARQLCRFRACALSSVVLAGLDHQQRVPEGEPMLLRDAVEAEGSRQSESLQGQVQWLTDVAVVSPMLGLLGTLFGMMLAFNAVSARFDVVRPAELAEGVNKAMITTVMGLIVGIPAMMFSSYFKRRASKMIALLEGASAEIFGALLSRRKS